MFASCDFISVVWYSFVRALAYLSVSQKYSAIFDYLGEYGLIHRDRCEFLLLN